MYKGLYDSFGHWYRGGSVWFYSDPHFSDEEMKYLRPNYVGDEEQVKRINSKIGRKDTIVFLGDIGDTEWISKIRGYKVLIMGNHDAGAAKYQRDSFEVGTYTTIEAIEARQKGLIDSWELDKERDICIGYRDNHLFDEVYEGALIIGEKLILSHEPLEFPYALNIHGHDHAQPVVDEMHWNMCAEHINYTPVCIKEIINSGRLGKIETIHRETINAAADKKKRRGLELCLK